MAKLFREGVTGCDHLFINKNFEVKPYCGSRFASNNTNILSRIENSFARALMENKKLPKYVVVVLDNDLIEYLEYKEFGISGMYEHWLEYLAKNISKMIEDRKAALPLSAIRYEYPLVYWMALPHHKMFEDNAPRHKFNQTLESLMKVYSNMRVAKIKEVWNYENNHLTTATGRLISYGQTNTGMQ